MEAKGQHEHKIKLYFVYDKVLIREEEKEDHCKSYRENSE